MPRAASVNMKPRPRSRSNRPIRTFRGGNRAPGRRFALFVHSPLIGAPGLRYTGTNAVNFAESSMAESRPTILEMTDTPDLTGGAMIVGFSGWMDGAQVSVGTLDYLVEHLPASPVGTFRAQDLYILNVPGSMEITALFRPPVLIEEGLVQSLAMPRNDLFASQEANVLLLRGQEPNLGWERYADAVIEAAVRCKIADIYFVGSVGSVLPHTRDPIIWSTMSNPEFRTRLVQKGLTPANYEGPGSFATYLSERAKAAGLNMASMVAGIPSYIEGRNPRCIETMLERLRDIVGFELDLAEIQKQRTAFLTGVTTAMAKNPKLAERITELEKLLDGESDGETSEEEDDEMREWFESQNLKLDDL